MKPMRLPFLTTILASLALAACGDDRVGPEQPPYLVPLSSSHQTDTVLATLPLPLRVQALEAGAPVPGAEVRWWLDDRGEVSSVADAEGVSQVRWTLGSSVGHKHARAWLEGAEDKAVQFTALATPGRPVALMEPQETYRAPHVQEQVGLVGAPLTFDYWTAAVDAYGNLVADVQIAWQITLGGGSIEEVPSPYEGYAYARHTVGPAEGPQQATATAPYLPGAPNVKFDATAVTALVAVDHQGASFSLDSVAVTVGRSVGWLWATSYDEGYNSSPTEHDVVFEDDPTAPTSSELKGFGAHVRTFTVPGTYRYRCTAHSHGFISGQLGIVVVNPL